MNIIWSEERIRDEIKKLDKTTGLAGAELSITFNNSKSVLGSFYIQKKIPKKFQFSNYYFQNPNFPKEDAIDTIKHEYAHYMDYILSEGTGHGMGWKKCCFSINASPYRLYSDERAKYNMLRKEREQSESVKIEQHFVGNVIYHPKFGIGTIKEIRGDGSKKTLMVDFKEMGCKLLSALWVSDNCSHNVYSNDLACDE